MNEWEAHSDTDESSLSPTSTQKFAPFPFPDRPVIPHVDRHITSQELQLKKISTYIRSKRNQFPAVGIHVKENVQDNVNTTDSSFDKLSSNDAKDIIKFIFRYNKDSNYISLNSLEAAFRKCSQLSESFSDELSWQIMSDLASYLKSLKWNIHQWYLELLENQTVPTKDGKITMLQLKYGIRRICSKMKVSEWSDETIYSLFRCIDPYGEGSVTELQLINVFTSLSRKINDDSIISNNSYKLMQKYNVDNMSTQQILNLLKNLNQKQQLIRDLFRSLDIHQRNKVSILHLGEALDRIMDDECSSKLSNTKSVCSLSSISSSINSITPIKLPVIGCTNTRNKRLQKRLEETLKKKSSENEESKDMSELDGRLIRDDNGSGDSIVANGEGGGIINTVNKHRFQHPFQIEESKLRESDNSSIRPFPHKSMSRIFVCDEDSDDDDYDDMSSYHTSSSRLPPVLSLNSKSSKEFSEFQSDFNILAGCEGNTTTSKSTKKKMNTRSKKLKLKNEMNVIRKKDHLRNIIHEESEAYEMFTEQFDKRVELYLKRLSCV